MILDAQALFSDAQAITAQAVSTNAYDAGSVRNLGTGQRLSIVIVVDTAFTDTGSDSTLAVELVTDDNSSLSSPTVIATLGTFSALSAAGTKIVAALPQGAVYERYFGLRYTPAGGNLTTGAVTAGIVLDADVYTYYQDAITIS